MAPIATSGTKITGLAYVPPIQTDENIHKDGSECLDADVRELSTEAFSNGLKKYNSKVQPVTSGTNRANIRQCKSSTRDITRTKFTGMTKLNKSGQFNGYFKNTQILDIFNVRNYKST